MAEIPRNQSEQNKHLSKILRNLRRKPTRIAEGESSFSEKAEQTFHGIWVVIKVILIIPFLVLVIFGAIFLIGWIIEIFSRII